MKTLNHLGVEISALHMAKYLTQMQFLQYDKQETEAEGVNLQVIKINTFCCGI